MNKNVEKTMDLIDKQGQAMIQLDKRLKRRQKLLSEKKTYDMLKKKAIALTATTSKANISMVESSRMSVSSKKK